MNDVFVGGLIDDLEAAIKEFVFYWNMGDHVMYRDVAERISIIGRDLYFETQTEEEE